MKTLAPLVTLAIVSLAVSGAMAEDPPVFVTKWGTSGAGPGQFNNPLDLAVDASGYVYVVDRMNHKITKTDGEGNLELEWGSNGTGDGEFQEPMSVAIDANGDVYVLDRWDCVGKYVQRFTSDGAFLGKWMATQGSPCEGVVGQMSDIEIDSHDNIWVVDAGAGVVRRFDHAGTPVTELTCGACPWTPAKICIDPSDNVYVSDELEHEIEKLTFDGTLVLAWGSHGDADGQFNLPYGIAVDSHGNLYVADYLGQRIQKFDSSGSFLTKWGTRGSGDGQFDGPADVALDASGNVYVVDLRNCRIQKFAPPTVQVQSSTWGRLKAERR